MRQTQQLIDIIALQIKDNSKDLEKLSITDSFYILLFLLVYDQEYESEDTSEKCQELLNHSINLIYQCKDFAFQTMSDQATSGWLLQSLLDLGVFEEKSIRIQDYMDDYLTIATEKMLACEVFTIDKGVIKIGYYWLKRNNRQELERIVDILDLKKESITNGIVWVRFCPKSFRFIVDLGFDKGCLGIIDFLVECYNSQIQKNKCREMISGFFYFVHENSIHELNHKVSHYPMVSSLRDIILLSRKESWASVWQDHRMGSQLEELIIEVQKVNITQRAEASTEMQIIEKYTTLQTFGTFHNDDIRDNLDGLEWAAKKLYEDNYSLDIPAGGKTLARLSRLGILFSATSKQYSTISSILGFELPIWLLREKN